MCWSLTKTRFFDSNILFCRSIEPAMQFEPEISILRAKFDDIACLLTSPTIRTLLNQIIKTGFYIWILYILRKVNKTENESESEAVPIDPKETETLPVSDQVPTSISEKDIPSPILNDTQETSSKGEQTLNSSLLDEFDKSLDENKTRTPNDQSGDKNSLLIRYRYRIIFVSIAVYYFVFKWQSSFFYGFLFGVLWTSMLSYFVFKLNERKYVESSCDETSSSLNLSISKHLTDECTDGVHKVESFRFVNANLGSR